MSNAIDSNLIDSNPSAIPSGKTARERVSKFGRILCTIGRCGEDRTITIVNRATVRRVASAVQNLVDFDGTTLVSDFDLERAIANARSEGSADRVRYYQRIYNARNGERVLIDGCELACWIGFGADSVI